MFKKIWEALRGENARQRFRAGILGEMAKVGVAGDRGGAGETHVTVARGTPAMGGRTAVEARRRFHRMGRGPGLRHERFLQGARGEGRMRGALLRDHAALRIRPGLEVRGLGGEERGKEK